MGYYLFVHYVYILKSIKFNESYVGQTNNLKNRISDHNSGKSKHTSKYKPWNIVGYYAFIDKEKALKFEKYLKTSSGKAFMKKRLL